MRKPLWLKRVAITFLGYRPKHGWVSIPVVLEKFGVPRRQRGEVAGSTSPSPHSNSYHVLSRAEAGLTNTSEVEHAMTQGASIWRLEVGHLHLWKEVNPEKSKQGTWGPHLQLCFKSVMRVV